MGQFLCKLIIISLYGLSFFLQAQTIEDASIQFPQSTKTENQERKKIEEVFALFNNNKQKEAYTITHQLLKKKLNFHSKANANLLLGHYFNSRELIDSSLFYSNRALKYSTLFQNDSLKIGLYVRVYNLFAINYKRKGLWEKSKKWHLKGISTSQKYGEVDFYYTHAHGLANVYREMGNFSEALKLYKECLTYKGDPEIIYGSYINIGIIHTLLKDYDLSNQYLEKALKLSKENDYATAVIKIKLAANYQEKNNIDKAILLYNEVLQLSEEKEYNQLAMDARLHIGEIYLDLKKYNNAELVYSSSLTDAIELGYLNQQKIIYDNLKDIYFVQNKYKKALQFATKSFKVKDSISKLQKDKEIAELEVKYKTQQKEKEIKLLQTENSNRKLELKNQNEAIKNLELKQEVEKKENINKTLSLQNASEKKQNVIALLKKDQEIQETKLIREKSMRNTILYSFLILLIPIIGLLIIYYQKLQTQSELNKKQEEINNQKISSLIKDQELKVIKASIKGQDEERKRIAQELHDSIGGNLAAIKLKLNNSINNNIKVDSLNTINNQIDFTYEQVRNLSHNLIPKKFNESSFCDVLEEYTNSIWGANSSFIVHPKKEINLLNENLQIEAFKIIQELATNTIKHAKATSIELQMNLVENELNILFEDNGIGFIPKNNKEGIGFTNVKNRLKELQGTFYIDSRINRGTIINIEIPTH